MMRDVFHISSFLVTNVLGHIIQITLNQAAFLTSILFDSFSGLLALGYTAIHLGQTEIFNQKALNLDKSGQSLRQ